MQTKAKSNSVITHEVTDHVITFNVLGVGALTLNTSRVHPEVMERAAIHGLIQRISDKAALGFDKDLGRYATAQEKYDAMSGLVAHYMSGSAEWSMRESGGEPKESGLTYRALAQVKGWDIEKAKASVAERASEKGIEVKAVLADMRKLPAIITAIADIKARAAGPVDTSLDDLT